MRNKISSAAILFFLCVSVFAQQTDIPAPPSWIRGSWTYIETIYEEDEKTEQMFRIIFTENDIIFDGGNLAGLIAQGEVTSFTQKTQPSSYEIYIQYIDGYWWREAFENTEGRDQMHSTYETAYGESDGCVYTRE